MEVSGCVAEEAEAEVSTAAGEAAAAFMEVAA